MRAKEADIWAVATWVAVILVAVEVLTQVKELKKPEDNANKQLPTIINGRRFTFLKIFGRNIGLRDKRGKREKERSLLHHTRLSNCQNDLL